MEIRHSKRLLLGIATLYGAGLAFLLYESVTADRVGRMIVLVGAALAAAILIRHVVLVIRNPVIGRIDQTGVFFASWGVDLIPWSDIAFFRIDVEGDGGQLIGIHLRDERAYLSRAGAFKALVSRLRKLLGFAPIVIFPGNVNVPMETLVQQLKQYVPEHRP